MKNTTSEFEALKSLAHEVSNYAHGKGEEWRIGEGTEIMDALNAYYDAEPLVVGEDEMTEELLSSIASNFERRTIKIRCVNCQNEIETTLGKLRQKFQRGSYWWTM